MVQWIGLSIGLAIFLPLLLLGHLAGWTGIRAGYGLVALLVGGSWSAARQLFYQR